MMIVGTVILAIVLLIFLGIAISSLSLWFQSFVSGAKAGLLNIIFMRFRKVPPKLVVEAKIMAKKAGIEISSDELASSFISWYNKCLNF